MTDPPDETLRPALRLFLSADIVGSTAHKQRLAADARPSRSGASPWFEPIAGFYRETERVFAREWKRFTDVTAKRVGLEPGPAPEMWKGLGDEAIYTKIVTDHRQARWCIQCWVKTVQQVRATFVDKDYGLDVKASAWLAGFPITNSEIVFRSKLDSHDPLLDDDDHVVMSYQRLEEFYRNPRSGDYTKDFIGPSMDIGFRLSAYSTARKLMISVDLALMLAVAMHPSDDEMMELRFFYEGRKPLRGVIRDVPYPLFWLDIIGSKDKLSFSEDAIVGLKDIPSSNLIVFVEEFLKRTPGLFEPYIDGELESHFTRKPNDHERKLDFLRNYIRNELQKRRDEKASGSELISEEDERTASETRFHLPVIHGRM